MRGPGETQIETDRRIIKNKISLLKKKLKKIEQQNPAKVNPYQLASMTLIRISNRLPLIATYHLDVQMVSSQIRPRSLIPISIP